jgi:hypothetical protein
MLTDSAGRALFRIYKIVLANVNDILPGYNFTLDVDDIRIPTP